MAGQTYTLENQSSIYIEDWAVLAQFRNLTQIGKALGVDSLVGIALPLDTGKTNYAGLIRALCDAPDEELCSQMVKHFVMNAAIDGTRITEGNFEEFFSGKMSLVAEVFCLVMRAQYASFFELGSPKVVSPAA